MRFTLPIYICLTLVCFAANCGKTIDIPSYPETVASQTLEQGQTEPTASQIEPEYPGITIDQKFPIISNHSFSEEGISGKNFDIEALGFKVGIQNFAPVNIRRNSEVLLKFKALTPYDYW